MDELSQAKKVRSFAINISGGDFVGGTIRREKEAERGTDEGMVALLFVVLVLAL